MEIKSKKLVFEYCEKCNKKTKNLGLLNNGIVTIECVECGHIKRMRGI